jgi:hypothetical protein
VVTRQRLSAGATTMSSSRAGLDLILDGLERLRLARETTA